MPLKSNLTQRKDIDSIITFILIKKLVTPIVKTTAFKLGLVNNTGKILREPINDEEKHSLTVLDKVIFKIKRLLGTKAINLQSFLYLQTMNNDMYNKLIVRGSVQNRAEIIRIAKDVRRVAESSGKDLEDILMYVLKENIDNLDSNDSLIKEQEE